MLGWTQQKLALNLLDTTPKYHTIPRLRFHNECIGPFITCICLAHDSSDIIVNQKVEKKILMAVVLFYILHSQPPHSPLQKEYKIVYFVEVYYQALFQVPKMSVITTSQVWY
jgi:hypothetical protein